ncbi:MAG: hypothetical protein HUU18_00580 [Phycisphaerales bacterium]|nr:hypothetical protein [Phycisphaerales bacterium]
MKMFPVSAAALVAFAGHAIAQPTVNGTRVGDEAFYTTPLFVQNQPTSFGDNTAGLIGAAGNPQAVFTGLEFAIPLSALGNPTISNVALFGVISSGSYDYFSNQITGVLPTNNPNLADPRNVDFSAPAFPGNQFIDLQLARITGPAPVIDGAYESSYGAAKFIQGNYTGFGNANSGNAVSANGSEIDQVFAVVHDNNTPADTTDDILYLLVAGNLETNYNKLSLFFDSLPAQGQNQLRGDNPNVDFNGLNRMGDSGSGNGLKFDAAFSPDYWIAITNGWTGSNHAMFVNYSELLTGGAGFGTYVGTAAEPYPIGGTLTLQAGAPDIRAFILNSNTAGVPGAPVGLSTPHPDVSRGSEIDAVYAHADTANDSLYILITGNLETNFQKLDLFFDVNASEGQNQLLGYASLNENPDVEFDGLNRMGAGGNGTEGAGNGLKFDEGFTADYFLSITNGAFPVDNYANACILRTDGRFEISGFVMDYSAFDGGAKASNNPIDFPGTFATIQDFTSANPINTDAGPRATGNDPNTLIPDLIHVSIDNNNVAGVEGVPSTNVADAANVQTGIEIRVRLSELGWDGTSPIKLAGFINAQGHSFVSNQVIGGLTSPGVDPYAPSLGEPTLIDFTTDPLTQFVIIPTSGGPACPWSSGGCIADYNGSGGTPDDADVAAFFDAWNSGDECSDANGSGGTPDDADVAMFFELWNNGGC